MRPINMKKDKRANVDFLTFKKNPFRDRYKTSLCLIPRVVVKPDESATPSYLEIKKTLNKSEYYIYKHKKIDYNSCEAKEVEELEIYSLFSQKFR